MAEEIRITTAAEFKQSKRARAEKEFEDPAPVVFPSGKAAVLRRPKPAYFALMGFPLPVSLAARLAAGEIRDVPAPELEEAATRIVKLFQAAFIDPRISLTPGEDEIAPNDIDPEDEKFLFRYLIGEVLQAGGRGQTADLGEFRRESGVFDGGAGGENVAVPAERPHLVNGPKVSN